MTPRGGRLQAQPVGIEPTSLPPQPNGNLVAKAGTSSVLDDPPESSGTTLLGWPWPWGGVARKSLS